MRIRKRASEKKSASLCGSLDARNIRSSTVGYAVVVEKEKTPVTPKSSLGRLPTGVLVVDSAATSTHPVFDKSRVFAMPRDTNRFTDDTSPVHIQEVDQKMPVTTHPSSRVFALPCDTQRKVHRYFTQVVSA